MKSFSGLLLSQVQSFGVTALLFGVALTRLSAAMPTTLWADEFNQTVGTAPNSVNWGYDLGGGGWGNGELETYTNTLGNAQVVTDSSALDNRALAITAIKTGSGSTATYTSARILSSGKVSAKYGRVEARLKVPAGNGLWPAFWMLGTDIGTSVSGTTVSWPGCGEIDIMEILGKAPGTTYGTIHGPTTMFLGQGAADYNNYAGIGGNVTLPSGALFSAAYHVIAVDWSPDKIVWSVDGIPYETRTPSDLPSGAPWVFNAPFFIILNLAVGGPTSGFSGPVDSTTPFPATYLIDYVRVYGLPSAAPTGGAASAPSPNNQVNISWTAPSDLKGFTLTGYHIDRATDSGFTQNIAGFDPAGTSTLFTDTTIQGGTTYFYRVSAVGTGGISDPSTSFSVSTPVSTTAPTITTQPASQTIVPGSPVTFTAAASGNPAPIYQWEKNTVNIAGATSSSYTIASAAAGDAGNYTVVASNSFGSVRSDVALLVVMIPPFNAIITITVE